MAPKRPFSPPKTTKNCAHCGIASASTIVGAGKRTGSSALRTCHGITEGIDLDVSLSRENAIAFDHVSLYKEFCGEQAFRRGR
jgi:hypothetical protein